MNANGGRPARRRAFVILAVTFVVGMACGAAVLQIGARAFGLPGPPGGRPGGGAHRPMEHLSLTLDLDDAQRAQVRALLGDQRVRMKALLEESRREIRDVLRPDQRERFDRMRPEDRRRGDRLHRGGRRGPPPDGHGPPAGGGPEPPGPEPSGGGPPE